MGRNYKRLPKAIACNVYPSPTAYYFSFFVAVVVYFAGGIAYMRFKNHAEGLDMIPNLEFWASLPGLIKYDINCLLNE